MGAPDDFFAADWRSVTPGVFSALGITLVHGRLIESLDIATAEDIDLAIQNGLGLRFPAYGLLTHQDNVGLDLTLAVNAYVSPDLYRDPEPPPYLRSLVSRGDLGVKTGRGFFDWTDRSAEDAKAKRDQFLIGFLRSRQTGPAQLA